MEENKNTVPEKRRVKKKQSSDKSWAITLVFCIFLGVIGFHRFYVGKSGTAILMLLTFGGFGIWALVDLITILINGFTDDDGNVIMRKSSVKTL